MSDTLFFKPDVAADKLEAAYQRLADATAAWNSAEDYAKPAAWQRVVEADSALTKIQKEDRR